MVNVAACIWYQHNIWLVLLAAVICALGCLAVVGLFSRAVDSFGPQRLGWAFLAAVAAGSSIWCTHFLAILAFDSGAPVEFDASLTVLSLIVAIVGSTIGMMVATARFARFAPLIGGALVGLAIAAMHYTGMLAYRVQGIVEWRQSYVFASIAIAVVFSSLATELMARPSQRRWRLGAAATLLVAIVGLHFTGMTAFRVTPLLIDHVVTNGEAMLALALAVACVALVILATGAVSFLIDTGVRADAYQKLRDLAMNDALTGLPNRTAFYEHLDAEIEPAAARGHSFALFDIDLDDFSDINDLSGHGVGDEVLRLVARRLAGLSSEVALIARVGGDEFAGIHRSPNRAELLAFLESLRAKLMEPIRCGDAEFSIGASFGVAIYPEDAVDKESLLNNADLALYRAKSDPLEKICFYRSEMGDLVRARRKLMAELREAVDRSRLELYYQVQKSVSTGEIVGYEALLRWRHPERGFIPPSEFIPLAEESGLIVTLGAWVLKTACTHAAASPWLCKIGVNLSPIQLAHANLPKLVHEILVETSLDANRLELELTESAIIADKQRTLETLRRIKALGVSVALDDFGTGYSSLETLRAFPFDKIKLDRSFMSEIETSDSAKAILRAVLALGRSLGAPVLAEGIETEGQLSMLAREGCSEAQGFLLGRPASLLRHIADRRLLAEAASSPNWELAGTSRSPRSSSPDGRLAS